MSNYEEIFSLSIQKPQEFWAKQAERVHWFKKWDTVLDDSNPPFSRWFKGGKTNICYNAVDRHALGKKRGQAAIIWESPETGTSRVITYFELYREVNKVASMLKNLGVGKGDRVLIYLPMVPEAAFAMLACVRIGAVHSVVFAGFSVESLADRIDDATPKAVLTADASTRKGTKIVDLYSLVAAGLDHAKHKPENVVVLNRGIKEFSPREGRDLDWQESIENLGNDMIPCEELDSDDPSYILYTSGTTAKPKGVVRDTAGYLVALATTMDLLYDTHDGDVYWSTSDIGWVVGHSYIVYGPLIAGVPTVMFEGTPDYPDPSIWFKTIEKYGITVVFSAPTGFRMLRKYDEKYITDCDLSSLRYLFLAGEPLDEPTYTWAVKVLGTHIIDHYWQTESGWAMISNFPGVEFLPIKPGSPTKASIGWDLKVVDGFGKEVERGTKGVLVSQTPLPPGALLTLYGDDERFVEAYYGKYGSEMYYSGDYAIQDKDGYFWMLGRADEVINVAGHRLGTRELEEIVSSHPKVAECSTIGFKHDIKGEAIAVFAVLKQGFEGNDELRKEIVKMVRDKIGPIATPEKLEFVKALPKTRSGKVMRRVLKALCEERDLGDMSTIEDGASVDDIKKALDIMKAP